MKVRVWIKYNTSGMTDDGEIVFTGEKIGVHTDDAGILCVTGWVSDVYPNGATQLFAPGVWQSVTTPGTKVDAS